MEKRVRVWVVGHDDRAWEAAELLSQHGFAVESASRGLQRMNDIDTVRWADVIVIAADGDKLDPAQSVTLGLALGARRPVVFISPNPVRFPVIASSSFTLIDPVSPEALAFQLESLGAKRASARASRKLDPTPTRSPQSSHRVERRRPTLQFDSPVEARAYDLLARDGSVSKIVREAPIETANELRTIVPDFLVWVEGAAPFNPLPLEVTGSRSTRAVVDRLFRAMEASEARLGVLIAERGQRSNDPEIEIRDGRAVLWIEMASMETVGWSLADGARLARNRLLHSGGERGEL